MYTVERMCRVLNVSPSSYYSSLTRSLSKRALFNEFLLKEIKSIFDLSKKTYGSPRVHDGLKDKGIKVSKKRVSNLMKKHNLKSIVKRKYKATTDSEHKYPIVENKLKRNFSTHYIGQVWVSDITYIKTSKGWFYLTVIIDLCDRQVIGWSLSTNLSARDTSIRAYRMAIHNRPITGKLIFHSDRGVQYACHAFKNLLNANGNIIRSMSRKGDCWDNAVAESFFSTLKTECIYQYKFKTREQAALIVFEYIETCYNTHRKHSTLNYKSPKQFEQELIAIKKSA
tara:strand:+ start:402 stop:1250 length:849 start_codon:yes stop_codon:yes gene_type:complete